MPRNRCRLSCHVLWTTITISNATTESMTILVPACMSTAPIMYTTMRSRNRFA